MALDSSGLYFIGPIVDPLFWLFSAAFRARKRADWHREGARSRIAEVGMWFVIWFFTISIATVMAAAWLSEPGADTSDHSKIQSSAQE